MHTTIIFSYTMFASEPFKTQTKMSGFLVALKTKQVKVGVLDVTLLKNFIILILNSGYLFLPSYPLKKVTHDS